MGTRGVKKKKKWEWKRDSAREGAKREKKMKKMKKKAKKDNSRMLCVWAWREWVFPLVLDGGPADLRKGERDPERRPRTRVGTWQWGARKLRGAGVVVGGWWDFS